ncbi:hypothetical protein BD769DRAFT_1782149 [Suillus cothurnatus]|nr:hypothetical protein BD769DRAFT_1782149 [Suillus cothurnatus]
MARTKKAPRRFETTHSVPSAPSTLRKSLSSPDGTSNVVTYVSDDFPFLVTSANRSKSIAATATGGVKKPHRFRPGTVALREIRRYQSPPSCSSASSHSRGSCARSLRTLRYDHLSLACNTKMLTPCRPTFASSRPLFALQEASEGKSMHLLTVTIAHACLLVQLIWYLSLRTPIWLPFTPRGSPCKLRPPNY